MKHLLTGLMIAICAIFPTSCAKAMSTSDTNKTADTAETAAVASPAPNPGDVLVDINTTEGDIRVRLFGITPKHRDNFVKLVNEGYYNGVLFHRVINEFMIQTGDGNSKTARPGQMLGDGDPNYTIEAEINVPALFHKRGALAAARTGDEVNPERRSSGSQFYIVTGRKFTDAQLDRMEQQMGQQQLQGIFNRLAMTHMKEIREMQERGDKAGLDALQAELVKQTEAEAAQNPARFTPEMRQAYKTVGGAPHLDGAYTVFGEVVSGMDVVEKIEKAETDANDRPTADIRVNSMKIVE